MSVVDHSAVLIEVARRAVADLRRDDLFGRHISLDATLQHDLGLDSLGRVELLHRVEEAFKVRLPDQTFESVATLRDLLRAVERAGPPLLAGAPAAGVSARAPEGIEAAPDTTATLIEALHWHVTRHPNAAGLVLISQAGEQPLTYAELWNRALAVAGGLHSRGVAPGETVALMLPTGADYFAAFAGLLLGGCIPVPIYPVGQAAQLEEHIRRHARLLATARVVAMVTDRSVHRLGRLLQAHVPRLRHLATVTDLIAAGRPATAAAAGGDTLAFLQFTSGSTGDPKGVMLTHAQILANIRAMGRSIRASSADRFVSWLPLYHDMGLIGAWFGTLYYGAPLIVMSPLAFLSRPERWLWAIHRHRATLSAAPNFAYELCTKRIADADLAGLDLSSWRIAFNGAETVLPETLDRFCARFGPYGFRREAMTPVYGLAECAVGLAFPPLGRGPIVDRVAREPFMGTGEALIAPPDDPNPLRFVGCGVPLPGYEVRIVDEARHEMGERQEGRLEFRGPSATHGYFDNPAATGRLIRDGWLDSGDRAYVAGGEIFVTGRIKDIVIRRGRHIHPDELEAAVGALEGVRKGCVAVFGSSSTATATERLVIMAETYLTDSAPRARLSAAITARVVRAIGEPPDEVLLVPPHTVLKTSSGKIRRAATREVYELGSHLAGPRAAWLQVLRLAVASGQPIVTRLLRSLTRLAYAAYFWTVVAVISALVLPSVVLLPRRRTALAVARHGACAILRAVGLSAAVRGREYVPRSGPCVLVANHASYLDGLVLLCVLPRECRFTAKRELLDKWIPRLFLQQLGAVFVTRDETREGLASAEAMTAAVREGAALVVFAEGTFTRSPGLRPFHLGGFVAAAATGAPTVPLAIQGTRSALRDGQWFPLRGPIAIDIGPPLPAPAERGTISAALAIRDAARSYIAHHCGEPEIEEV